MTPSEAAQILEALARGIDPETGEVLPENSPINSTHVLRALFLGAKALRESSPLKPPQRPTVEGTEQAWKPWTKEEEVRLVAAFQNGTSVQALATDHQRKIGGIRARLMRLGQLTPASHDDNAA